jgi:hypothetical protein
MASTQLFRAVDPIPHTPDVPTFLRAARSRGCWSHLKSPWKLR